MINKLGVYNLASIAMAFLVGLSFILPEWTWGFNYLTFLPKPLIFLVVVLCATLFWFLKPKQKSNSTLKKYDFKEGVALIAFPIIIALTTYLLPLVTQAYGDSRSILSNYDNFFSSNRSLIKCILALFEPDLFNLHSGEKFTFNAIYIIKSILRIDIADAFAIYSSTLGFLSTLVFTYTLRFFPNVSKPIAFLLLLSSNVILVFSGHIEVYAAFVFFSFLFVFALKLHLVHNKNITLLLMVFTSYFLLKSHISGVFIAAPVIALAILRFNEKAIKFFTIKDAFVLIVSGAIGFTLAYFFVFKNHNSNYADREGDVLTNVFLPLFGSELPFNSYGIFHVNHLIDFVSLILMWSPIVFLIIGIFMLKKSFSKFLFGADMVIFVFLTITFILSAFVVNPLLSMPRDWDLLSLGAPYFLFVAIALLQSADESLKKIIYPIIIIGFTCFTIPRFIVESNTQLSSDRMLNLGSRVYKTYYAGSSVLLSMAVKQQENPDYDYLKSLAEDLVESGEIYPDNELCHFLTQTAYWLADQKGKKVLALDFFRLALEQNNQYEIALKGAIILLQNQNRLEESLPLVNMILNIQPNIKEYHQMLLNCYVGLKMKKELQVAVNNYLKLFPKDRDLIYSKLGI